MVSVHTPMHKIEPQLYLGSLKAAKNKHLLELEGINSIVQVLSADSAQEHHENINYHCIQIDDSPENDIVIHIPSAIEFIQDQIANGKNVLVHCAYGVSRSASIIIGFLMTKYGICYDEALRRVKEKRRCVNPNPGFEMQLRTMNIDELRLRLTAFNSD